MPRYKEKPQAIPTLPEKAESEDEIKLRRLALLLDKCCAEGLLDVKALAGVNDCQWCPFKAECDKAWEECSMCSYTECERKLKAVFRLKHQWAKRHSTRDLVKQTI